MFLPAEPLFLAEPLTEYPPVDHTRLFVGNLHYATTEESMWLIVNAIAKQAGGLTGPSDLKLVSRVMPMSHVWCLG